jgi:E3 ubiquitin-protein ligase TRIP12
MEPDSSHRQQPAADPSPERRSSARVRATKQSSTDTTSPSSSHVALKRRTRSSAPDPEPVPSTARDKGKAKEVISQPSRPAKRYVFLFFCSFSSGWCLISHLGRPRRSQPLAINEPPHDPKGKKRAAPEPESDEEDPNSPRKKQRYALRSRKHETSPRMTRKTR